MTSEDSIPTRYVRYPEGGGAVWVQVRNRFVHYPRDAYNDEWFCVWSSRPYDAGQVLSTLDTHFYACSEAGPLIPLPWGEDNGQVARHSQDPLTQQASVE
jgi:hypothetical protein